MTKCPYCDFNVHIRKDIDQDRWRRAYKRALRHEASLAPGRVVSSIFFGGGTPSLMPPETVSALIEEIAALWPLDDSAEITLEANPDDVEAGKFKAFRDAGVNRLSLGVQSLNDHDLSFLGRRHDAEQSLQALDTAAQIFERYSFDLIYARPDQSLDSWDAELRSAIKHARGHMSLYQLTIEPGTKFYRQNARGDFLMPDDIKAADFYTLTQDIMTDAGLPAYEVSNHAAPGHESRHNMTYWLYGEYSGIGPGAHGRLVLDDGVRHATHSHRSPSVWLKNVESQGHAHQPFEALPPAAQFAEGLMMGLRLSRGINLQDLADKTGAVWQEQLDIACMQTLADQGWLTLSDDSLITLSRAGTLRLNMVIKYILRTG